MRENLFKPDSIRLYSGKYLNLLNPDPDDIFAIDIAVGLARECRWGNHSRKFYSVAEHSIECMNRAEDLPHETDLLAFECLMHDAAEAYLGDIPRPLKSLLPHYRDMEENVMKAIAARFGIRYPFANEYTVRMIDNAVLKEEWEGKMLRWKGLEMDEQSRVDTFIHHLVRLCKIPAPIRP